MRAGWGQFCGHDEARSLVDVRGGRSDHPYVCRLRALVAELGVAGARGEPFGVLRPERAQVDPLVAEAAIAIDQAGSYVYVVNDKNVAEQRRVSGQLSAGGSAVEEGAAA